VNDAAVLRLVFSLLFVLALILGGGWLARRAGWLRMRPRQLIRLAETRHIGPRAYVAVVEIEGARLLLGVAGGQVSLLHRLADGPAPDDAADRAAGPDALVPTQAPAASFAGALNRVLAARRGRC
jgi:flagellar protein FliO/FliZ